MENTQDNFYNFSSEKFKDERYDDAVKEFPKDALVFLLKTGQVGMVEEIRATADGIAIRVGTIGLVPIDELRLATDEEIERSKFKIGK